MDANARIGTPMGEDADMNFYPYVGLCSPDLETKNGIKFRQFLVDLELIAVNSHWDCGCTFYDQHGGQSRLDYVVIKAGDLVKVEDCRRWMKSGDRLQNIKGAMGRREHRPVAVTMDTMLDYCPDDVPVTYWVARGFADE